MTNYKGYYIDNVIFHSKSDIDAFVKEQAINKYKMLVEMFSRKPSMELSCMMSDHADRLHKVFGLSYGEIEDIEIAVFKAA